MTKVCLYFQVHQPRRLRKFQVFDIGQDVDYFADYEDGMHTSNPAELRKIANKTYLPANKIIQQLLADHPELKITFSFTGIFLEQLEEFMPEVLTSFRNLVDTGQVEILGETYYHSIASIYSEEEFVEQIEQHSQKINSLFGLNPQILKNTELIYNNDVAKIAKKLGFRAVIAGGAEKTLDWRSPNFLYAAPNGLPLLVKNHQLSDDIALRFSEKNWPEYPITAEKFGSWVSQDQNSEIINLFMDYETFGTHHKESSGIFDFLLGMPQAVLSTKSAAFTNPSEVALTVTPKEELDISDHISQGGDQRNLSTWLHNDMQHSYADKVFNLRDRVMATQDEGLISTWRHLQESHHFTQLATDLAHSATKNKFLNHFESPYVAFLSYMNMIQDLDYRLRQVENSQPKSTEVLASQPEQQQDKTLPELPDLDLAF